MGVKGQLSVTLEGPKNNKSIDEQSTLGIALLFLKILIGNQNLTSKDC